MAQLIEPEKFHKLPKWAQSYIGNLQYQNRELQNQLEVAQAKTPESRTAIRRFTTLGNIRHFIPDEVQVEFRVGDNDLISVGIDSSQYVCKKDEGRVINVSSNNALLVRPLASNSIQLVTR
jgi:hypothetical protein